jgi:hypothetical protein
MTLPSVYQALPIAMEWPIAMMDLMNLKLNAMIQIAHVPPITSNVYTLGGAFLTCGFATQRMTVVTIQMSLRIYIHAAPILVTVHAISPACVTGQVIADVSLWTFCVMGPATVNLQRMRI